MLATVRRGVEGNASKILVGDSRCDEATATKVGGIIKFFKEDKGFGFITIDAEYPDIFAHKSQVADENYNPKKGDKVTFIEDRGRDGRPYARRIVVVK